MKIILEEKDLIDLLGKALGTTLDPTNVRITADPFEVTVMEAAKVLKKVEEPLTEGIPSEPIQNEQHEEATPEDIARLMGVSDKLIKVGSPTSTPKIDGVNTVLVPPPTKDGKEVF